MNEQQARAVLLVQCFEEADEGPLWTAEDRQWATRAAQQSLQADPAAVQDRERFAVERARLALQRLAPRDATVRRLAAAATGRPLSPLLALLGGGVLGVASDALVAGDYFNLLGPLFWGLLAWNLAIYLGLAMAALRPARPGGLAARLGRTLVRWGRRLPRRGPLGVFAARWAEVGASLAAARGATLLHLAAAGMALGLMAGLWLRGLVFDYRAGWATTLLQPETVRAALAALLWPAHAITGIAPPDAAAFEALRVLPGQPPQASAAPWIVLMVVQLALVVVLPRLLLALVSAWRGAARARRFALPLTGPYFDRLVPATAPKALWVLPHAQAPQPQAVLGLRAILARVWGEALPLQIAPALAYGEEEHPPSVPAGARTLVLVDLSATPEPDVHGRLLAAVAAGGAVPLLLVDEGPFLRRFGAGARRDERVAAWRALAREQRTGLVVADLDAPDLPVAEAALRAALEAA